ncbi:hypothetical protein HDU67_010359, partial [Dinochytrium kinnereticum]
SEDIAEKHITQVDEHFVERHYVLRAGMYISTDVTFWEDQFDLEGDRVKQFDALSPKAKYDYSQLFPAITNETPMPCQRKEH